MVFNDDFCRSSYHSWAQLAEETLPLQLSFRNGLAGSGGNGAGGGYTNTKALSLEASVELRIRRLSARVVFINSMSLIVNVALAIAAFYFAFTRSNTSATLAFAADCALDAISSAIVLWRFHGNLSSVYMFAREQIACIYLGVLFEISALAIAVESISGLVNGRQHQPDNLQSVKTFPGGDDDDNLTLEYLALSAAFVMGVLTVFKTFLYRSLRDNSILLDVINSFISTAFAISILMSQALINFNPAFWYLDPALSIALAVFMAFFGLKVIHENFNILKPTETSCSMYESCSNNRQYATASSANANRHHIFDSITIAIPSPTPSLRKVSDSTNLTSKSLGNFAHYPSINH